MRYPRRWVTGWHRFSEISRRAFGGPISTIKCFEDNSLVAEAVEEPGAGRVLVVDGGASDRCALLGDNLARRLRLMAGPVS